jgi:hypothetical protein
MVKTAIKHVFKVVLLTPTPGITESLSDPNTLFAQHTLQIIYVGLKYHVLVVKSYAKFKAIAANVLDFSNMIYNWP